jgi:ferritin-like metal-binding protein YciE
MQCSPARRIGTVRAPLAAESRRPMHKRLLIGWLKDAHTMETRSLPILQRRVGDKPLGLDAHARLESHLREKAQHAERLRQALRALGSAPPPVLRRSAPIVVLTQDITSRVFSDRLVSSAIADLAAEQFEVAAYTALIAAAEHTGEAEVARLCRLNRGEDEEMAEWLDARISIVIGRTLAHAPANR